MLGHADAITKKQIMRNLGLPTRSTLENRRSLPDIKPEITEDDKTYNAFHIHKDFECDTDVLTDFNPHELSANSVIDPTILPDNPLAFAIGIETIKAHLEIVLKSYYSEGINFDFEKYTIRYHHEKELFSYPEYVALEPNETGKVYYPDTLRSAVYVYYVILPVFEQSMTKAEYIKLLNMMSVVSFRKVLEENEKRVIWQYKKYYQYVQKIYQLLDTIEAKYLQKHNLSRDNPVFQRQIINALLTNNWASFLSVQSCALITPPYDPGYDTNFYYDPPVTRDSYLMGLGLFQRGKKLAQNYLFHQKSVDETNAFYAIQKYIDFFDNFYAHIEFKLNDMMPYAQLDKLHTDAVCSLGLPNTEGCEKSE